VTSEDEIECDVPANDDCSPIFTTFSNPLFNNDNLDSSDDESLPDEDVPVEDFKIYLNPLFDKDEINSDKLDPHCFNVESNFVESLLNHDTFIQSSSKFDFSGELTHVNPEIPKSDFDFEEEIRFIENLLYDNSFPRPVHIDPIPPGIEEADFDLEEEIRPVEKLLIVCDDPLSLLENELSNFDHHDDPSFPRPPPKPPDVVPTLCLSFDTLLPFSSENEDKVFKPGILSYLLVSHRDKTIFDFSESPMMMYGGDIPLLDVEYLYFYPP
nr:hypothetical protein [Tanacetum cinerariifolium]